MTQAISSYQKRIFNNLSAHHEYIPKKCKKNLVDTNKCLNLTRYETNQNPPEKKNFGNINNIQTSFELTIEQKRKYWKWMKTKKKKNVIHTSKEHQVVVVKLHSIPRAKCDGKTFSLWHFELWWNRLHLHIKTKLEFDRFGVHILGWEKEKIPQWMLRSELAPVDISHGQFSLLNFSNFFFH